MHLRDRRCARTLRPLFVYANACGLVRVRHTPFPGQSEYFVAILLTLFDSYWRYFYLNRYCSSMLLCTFFTVFYKSGKTCFLIFYLQINVFNIYAFVTTDWSAGGLSQLTANGRNKQFLLYDKIRQRMLACATFIDSLDYLTCTEYKKK